MFTEVLAKADWLRLFDHLFTYKDDPELLLFYAAAFLKANRSTIIQQVFEIEDMIAFQSRTSTVPFKKLTDMAFRMHHAMRETIFAGNVQNALPLPKGDYPVFNRYPEQVTVT